MINHLDFPLESAEFYFVVVVVVLSVLSCLEILLGKMYYERDITNPCTRKKLMGLLTTFIMRERLSEYTK